MSDDFGKNNRIEALADELLNAFDWDSTPQGHDYWNEVHKSLVAVKKPPVTIVKDCFDLYEYLGDKMATNKVYAVDPTGKKYRVKSVSCVGNEITLDLDE